MEVKNYTHQEALKKEKKTKKAVETKERDNKEKKKTGKKTSSSVLPDFDEFIKHFDENDAYHFLSFLLFSTRKQEIFVFLPEKTREKSTFLPSFKHSSPAKWQRRQP